MSSDPQRSAWLTHWAGRMSESSSHDHLTQFNRSKVGNYDMKKHPSRGEFASDNFGSSKGVGDLDLAMNLKKPGSQSFPFFKLGQESGRSSMSNKKEETRGALALEPQVSHKKLTTALNVETPSRESHFQPKAGPEIPTEQVKYHMFFGETSHSCSTPSKEKFTGSVSHLSLDQGAHKLHSCKTHAPENFSHLTAVFASKEYLPNTNAAAMQQEYPSYCSHSVALVSNQKLDDFPRHEKSDMPSFFREKNTAILETNPLTSRSHSPAIIEDQYSRKRKHIGMGFFPYQTGSPGVHGGSCSLQNLPHFIHGMETTRMCAPLGSAEGLAGGLIRFSRTTESLLITKQTDVKVYQDNQVFRESRVSTQLKREAIGEFNCSLPQFALGKQGVKLQLLDSSDQESQENAEDVKAAGDVQMNESADNDTMDMGLYTENHLSGALLSAQNKNIVESKLPLGPSIVMSAEKDTRGKREMDLPDMNLDLSTLPAASSSMEKSEPCPSRTQSLDINASQFNIDHTVNSKSDECADSNMGSVLGSTWIKRLKLNASSSLAHGKLNKFFTTAVEGSPEPALDKCHVNVKQSKSVMGKWHHSGSVASISAKGDSLRKQEHKDITLSHSWIQRWRHNPGEIIPEPIKSMKPEKSKSRAPPEEEFQKKQFPSIGAMALMGKAMSGYQECKFQKKESFVIWNTKSFD